MRNYLILDGKNSLDFGLFISGKGAYTSPAKKYEEMEVPGRNGKLLMDTNTFFDNVEVSYDAFMFEDLHNDYANHDNKIALDYSSLSERLGELRAFLGSRKGYFRIEDTYHQDEYRMGDFVKDISPTMSNGLKSAEFTLIFTCKPQRFLKSGEIAYDLTSNSGIFNPTMFDSKPLIRAYGTGSFTINGTTTTIKSANAYTDIDCDLMECYKGSTNCNGNVVLTNNQFPVFTPGDNSVSLSGITKLTITPRWWTI